MKGVKRGACEKIHKRVSLRAPAVRDGGSVAANADVVEARVSGGGGQREPEVWGRYLGAGLTWAVVTLVFAFAGLWLDGRWGTRPVMTLVMAFAGAAAGFWSMLRQLTGPGPGSGDGDR